MNRIEAQMEYNLTWLEAREAFMIGEKICCEGHGNGYYEYIGQDGQCYDHQGDVIGGSLFVFDSDDMNKKFAIWKEPKTEYVDYPVEIVLGDYRYDVNGDWNFIDIAPRKKGFIGYVYAEYNEPLNFCIAYKSFGCVVLSNRLLEGGEVIRPIAVRFANS